METGLFLLEAQCPIQAGGRIEKVLCGRQSSDLLPGGPQIMDDSSSN